MKIQVHELSVGDDHARRSLLRNFTLHCQPGVVTTLMGPSGCGKSSLLAAIAGLDVPGLHAKVDVALDGLALAGLPTSQRRIGLLFQDDLLFAHMNVLENLMFACPVGPSAARAAKAQQALVDLGFEAMAKRSPLTLSGGQRARISLMRALLAEPKALLLDEPFSKLDAVLRHQFRDFVFGHVRRLQLPTVLVTHDAADVADPGAVVDFAQIAR